METLLEVDPEFVLLCGALYGPDADAAEVWDDVFGVAKRRPLTPEERRAHTQKRVAQASNILGLTAGGAAIGATLRNDDLPGKVKSAAARIPAPYERRLKPKLTPKGLKIAALGAAGLQVANVGGDIVTNRVLGRKVDKGLGKITLQSVKGMASGIADSWKKAEQVARASVTDPAARAKQANMGRGVAAGIRHPVKAVKRNPGKSLVAGTGLAYAAGKKKNSPVQYEDAYYGKNEPDFEAAGEFTKFDDDKRLAFGWASVVKKDGVEVVDRQGDWIHPDDLENAAYKYVLSSRIGGDMHKRNGESPHHVSDLVESFVVTPEKIEKMGLPPETPIGWWVGFKVHDEDTWQLVKKKGRTGFSIHGRGKRSLHELDGY